MHDPNNIWKNRFNDDSLNDENWLEPSEDVFAAIEAEIYPEKKERKILFIILFFTLSISTLLFLLRPVSKTTNQLGETPIEQTTSNNSTLTNNTSSSNKEEEKEEKVLSKNDQIVDLALDKSQSKKASTSNALTKDNVKESNANAKESGAKKDKVLNFEKHTSTAHSIIGKESSEQNKDELSKSALSNTSADLVKKNINNKWNSNKPINIINKIEILSSITYSKLQAINARNIKILNPPIFINNTEVTIHDKNKYISFSLGYENWNFILNSNYATALDPADFTHSHGNGISANVGYGKSLSHKLNFELGLSLQKVDYKSGHNSSINYDLNNQSNSFDLTMASPLGFINSNISVESRNSVSNNSTELIVDLNNLHSLVNLDLQLGLDYALIENQKWQFIIGFNGGINYFVNISNELSSFGLDDSNFISSSSSIETNQGNVIKLTPYLGSNFKLNHFLNENYSIGLELSFKSNINPIFQENDFSTQVNRIGSSLFVRKMF